MCCYFVIICHENAQCVFVFVDGFFMTVMIGILPSVFDSIRFNLSRGGGILD